MHKSLTTRLRDIRSNDHAEIDRLRSDVALQKLLLGAREPITEKASDWLERRSGDGWTSAVTDQTDAFLGYVQLGSIHRDSRTAWFGICLIEKARGRGHGADATQLALSHARDRMNLRKVLLKVRADNPAAQLYGKIGFRTVGTLCEEYDSGDSIHDVKIMEILLGGQAGEPSIRHQPASAKDLRTR
jgi:RimJ/RimL family protein N-acetyltransferase